MALLGRRRFVVGAAFLLGIACAALLVNWVLSPVNVRSEPTTVVIEQGIGAAGIARILEREGLVRHWSAFSIYATTMGYATQLQAGTYRLCACQSVQELTDTLSSGRALSDDIEVTIPEGMNVWEIDELLQKQDLIVPGSFARTWAQHEGTLFPDTYRLDRSVASTAGEFQNARVIGQVFRDAFDRRTARHTTEQVIIASMLEKEAKSAEDMALVAGIIARRRELGMPLQLDATVAYGWCLRRWLPMSSTANCDVTQAPIAYEIKVDGPYNTYTRTGLPEGAIANPGLKALQAAASPTASDYLYYLSTRDGSQIIYSKTLQEHLQNRSKYLGF